MTPCVWTETVSQALIPALDGASLEDFQKDVQSGHLELWRHGACYIVTEQQGTTVRVWLVGGKGFFDAAFAINDVFVSRGCTHCVYRSRNPAAVRLYRFMNAELIDAETHEYRICPIRKS